VVAGDPRTGAGLPSGEPGEERFIPPQGAGRLGLTKDEDNAVPAEPPSKG